MASTVAQESVDHGDSNIEVVSTQFCTANAPTFHGFNKLPKELQLLIIRFHCEIPRLVPIWVTERLAPSRMITGHPERIDYHGFSSDSPEPAIMMVSKEIREEVQRSGIYRNLSFNPKTPWRDRRSQWNSPYCMNLWVSKNDLICPTVKEHEGRWTKNVIFSFGAWIMNHGKIERIVLDDLSSSDHTEWRNRWGDPRPRFPFQYTYISTILTHHVREIAFYVPKKLGGISPSTKFITKGEIRGTSGDWANLYKRTTEQVLFEVMDRLDWLKSSGNDCIYDEAVFGDLSLAAEWVYKNPDLFVRPSVTVMEIVEDDSNST
jgi:hypothetical protein